MSSPDYNYSIFKHNTSMTNSCTSVGETVENLVAHLFTQYCGDLATPHSIPDSSIKGINN